MKVDRVDIGEYRILKGKSLKVLLSALTFGLSACGLRLVACGRFSPLPTAHCLSTIGHSKKHSIFIKTL